jgi:GAF domain-containing protein
LTARGAPRSVRAYVGVEQHRPEAAEAIEAVSSLGGRARTRSGSPRRELSAARRVADERAYLYEVIQTIGSGPDLDTILRGVVRLATEATACHACLIWFAEAERLVLRSASAPYERQAGTISMAAGEGLAGWVATTRRSAFIRERALEDPRVRYFPEFEEERFQSLVAVPMLGRDGTVMGVISLHAEAPHEFARADLDLLEHTAALIAGAVENARHYEDATARVALLTNLSHLSQRIASAGKQDEVLDIVTEGVRHLLTADRCELYLLDADDRLRLAAARPERPAPTPLDTRTLWLEVLNGQRVARPSEEERKLAALLWGDDAAGEPCVAPLVVGEERLGILVTLLPRSARDAEAVLSAIAAHTAVALKQHQAIERLREKNLVKDFFLALARGDAPPEELSELARRLGSDLSQPHVVMHLLPWSAAPRASRGQPRGRVLAWPELAGQIEGRLAARFHGLLVDNLERSMRALVPIEEQTSGDAFAGIRSMEWGAAAGGTGLAVGVSNPCRGAAAFSRGFQEAEAAAEVGALIRGSPGVTSYEELGPYRYVLGSEADGRDRSQRCLELLVDYDRRRGAQLLDTLEGYLDHRGSVVTTSRALFIHPNTLRQRLDRIQRVAGIDLERDDWLSLAVAAKIVKLRRLRRSAGGLANEEGGNDS